MMSVTGNTRSEISTKKMMSELDHKANLDVPSRKIWGIE